MEPSLSWGLRMALAMVVPVVWGVSTGHVETARWIALSADCICWVALKGTYAQRLRVVLGGIILTLAFATLGSITGTSLWLSTGCMLAVAFFAGLFKNLGERGSGLALCIYVMFLLTNAYPVSILQLHERLVYVLIGGLWHAMLGMISIFFTPAQYPYRRTISIIWRASSGLMQAIAKGWDGKGVRSTHRQIYLAEKTVRNAIDNSFLFHERAAHQLRRKVDGDEYQLAQVRKAAALLAAHMTSIAGELESLRLQSVEEDLRLRIFLLLQALQRAAFRMGVLVLTRRAEEEVLTQYALEDVRKQLTFIEEYQDVHPLHLSATLRRVLHLSERCLKMLSRSMELLAGVSERSVFRSYSLMKTIYVLHPKHLWRNIRLLFNLDTHTARYAARTALASALGMAIYKWLDIDHGYWLPFTIGIVLQPYFTATFRKAIDRLIGTLAGGIAGGLLLLFPAHFYLKEAMLFISAVAMIHFFRVQYRISAFFITLNLVLLFSISQDLDKDIIFWRAGLTIIGAIIAVVAGFVLLPVWDRKWLPRFAAKAIERNWCYFRNTFLPQQDASPWTRYKRQAEVSNSNMFDSFNRATNEPGGLRKEYATYYQLITHNVRITRELNNIHLETETGNKAVAKPVETDEETRMLIQLCTEAFIDSLQAAQSLSETALTEDLTFNISGALPILTTSQKLYLNRLYTELKLMRQNLASLQASLANTEALHASA